MQGDGKGVGDGKKKQQVTNQQRNLPSGGNKMPTCNVPNRNIKLIIMILLLLLIIIMKYLYSANL